MDVAEKEPFIENILHEKDKTTDKLIKSINFQLINHELVNGCLYNILKMFRNGGMRTTAFSEFLAYAPLPTRVPPISTEYKQNIKEKLWRFYQARKIIDENKVPDIKFVYIESNNWAVNCAAFSHDATILAVGIRHIVMILQVNNKNVVSSKLRVENCDRSVLVGHTGTVQMVNFAPLNDYCVSTGDDLTIRLWSLECYMCLRIFSGHIGSIFKLCFSPDYTFIASAGYDKTIKIWSVNKTTKPLHVLKYHMADVNDIDIHPNGNYIASASSDALVIVWSAINGKKMRILKGHRAAVLQVKFSSCGRFLVSFGRYHKALIWDIHKAVMIAIFTIEGNAITSMYMTQNNNCLVAVSERNGSFWNISKLIKDYKNGRRPIFSQSYSLEEKCDHWRQWQCNYALMFWKTDSTMLSGILTYGNVFHVACIDNNEPPI